jgi:KDO2-lipid IV(A) lauroyltransferase
MSHVGARAAIALLWLLHWLPARWQWALGGGLGTLLHALAGPRRRIAQRNLELCLPELDARARAALVREHFRWLGRSLIERGLLWYAPRERLERLIDVEGDVGLAERTEGTVMWLVPHFLALEIAGLAILLRQSRPACDIYQRQSNAVFDAAITKGRHRFGNSALISRKDGIKPLLRAVRDEGRAFFNMPDMDFGRKESVFVPFFGVAAATLLAPSRLARMLKMTVQPVVAEMRPDGGWRVRFLPPWTDWPTDDPEADAKRMNAWIEAEVRRLPAQYLWVHKRFKTRPEGEQGLYGARG